MSWETSDRRSRLPKDWPWRVAQTKYRAGGMCEGISLRGEDRWHVETCDRIGRECDHDERGDDHSLTNLRWLSPRCHLHKTQQEVAEVQRAQAAKARFPRETHPGLTS